MKSRTAQDFDYSGRTNHAAWSCVFKFYHITYYFSPFLTGRTFASRTYFGVFVELRRSYIRGPKSLAQHVLGTFAQSGEHCLWFAESKDSSPVWGRNINKNRWRCRYFARFRGSWPYLLTCGRRSLVSGPQNDIVVSWITQWEMVTVYWLDFSWITQWEMVTVYWLDLTLAYISSEPN